MKSEKQIASLTYHFSLFTQPLGVAVISGGGDVGVGGPGVFWGGTAVGVAVGDGVMVGRTAVGDGVGVGALGSAVKVMGRASLCTTVLPFSSRTCQL